MKTIKEIRTALEQRKNRSAWAHGVTAYALNLVDDFEEWTEYAQENGEQLPTLNETTLLNGAKDWKQYSWGGSSLIYDCDIAKRLCTASELKRTDNGNRRPNSGEEWLDTQARALYQACRLVLETARN